MSEPPYARSSDGMLGQGNSVRSVNTPALQLEGADLTFIRIDFQSRLQFPDTEVVIETPFRLTFGAEQRTLDPNVRSELGPLLAVYPASVASAEICPDLTLRLRFTSGAAIDVPQDPRYEAWQVVGPGSRLLVCPPGNGSEVVVWQ